MQAETSHSISRAATILAGLALVLLSIFTSPLQNVSLVLLYLLLFYVFVLSGGYWLAYHHLGKSIKKAKVKVFVLATTVVTVIMLRSLEALGIFGLLLIILLAILLYFYLDRARKL